MNKVKIMMSLDIFELCLLNLIKNNSDKRMNHPSTSAILTDDILRKAYGRIHLPRLHSNFYAKYFSQVVYFCLPTKNILEEGGMRIACLEMESSVIDPAFSAF